MPASKEQLGIELSLSLDGKFADLIKKIEGAFKNIDLKGFEGKVDGLEGKLNSASVRISKVAKELERLTGQPAKDIQVNLNISELNKGVAAASKLTSEFRADLIKTSDGFKTFAEVAKETRKLAMQQLAAIKEDKDRTVSSYMERGKSILAIEKNTNSVMIADRKLAMQQLAAIKEDKDRVISSYTEKGKIILAIERNTNKAMLAERKLALQQLAALKEDRRLESDAGKNFLAGLRVQGLKVYNGDIVPKTYVENIDKAHAAALKFNKSLEDQQERVKRNRNEFSLFNISLSTMAKRLAEFYLIRGTYFAISNQITSAVSELIKFNQALYDTAAVANASNKSIAIFGDTAMQIAKSSKMNLEQTMQLMNLLAQSGVSEKDVPMVSRVAAMFATGTGSSPENAVRVLTTALNVWGIEAGRAGVVTDTLASGLNAAKIEVNELSTVFNYLAPTAKAAGYSLQETTAIIATMSQMGVKASTIGTGVGQSLTRLMSPTKGIKDLAAAYNIALDDLNPRLKKFSDIVDTLAKADGGKGVPVNDILRGFGQIAGRSMNAAVAAGGEYFREMERNVSNSNSTLIANARALEGVGAKLNHLRQTFVEAIGSMTAFKYIGGGIYEVLLGLARGISTTNGQIALAVSALGLAAAALYTFRIAILTFVTSNPLGVFITAVSLGLAGLINLLGTMSVETSRANREHSSLASKAGDLQRAFQEVSNIYSKAAKEGKLNNDMSKEHKERLAQLVREYPSLHGVLDTSITKYSKLLGVMRTMNAEMAKVQRSNADIYNSASKRVEQDKNKPMSFLGKSLNQLLSEEDTRMANDKLYYNEEEVARRSEDRKAKAYAKYRQFKRDDIELITKIRGEAPSWQPIGEVNVETASYSQLAYNPYTAPEDKSDKRGKLTGDKEGKHDTTEKIEDKIAAYLSTQVAERDKLKAAKLKLEREQIAQDVKDLKANEQDRIAKELEVIKMVDEEYALKATEIRVEAYNKAASVVGGTFDPKKGKDGTLEYAHGLDPNRIDDVIKSTEETIKAKLAELSAEQNKVLDGVDDKFGPPKKVYKAPYNATAAVKQADRELQASTQELAIKKELAKTADEAKNAELALQVAQMKNSASKERAYKLELESLERWLTAADATDERYAQNVERLKEVEDALYAIGQLSKEQEAKYLMSSDKGFGSNFMRGAYTTQVALGTTEERTKQLGATITSTLGDGLNNTINGMIDALGRGANAWESFYVSLGNIMKSIGDELQKYVVKLIAVWVMEQTLALFGGGTNTSKTSATPGGIGGTSFSVNPTSTSAGKFSLFADGGQVVGGTPGVDSVPAMLMPEEWVVKSSAVRKYGPAFMQALNEGRVRAFADGGAASPMATRSRSGEGGGFAGTLQIINLVDPNSIPQTTDAQIINVINMDIVRRGSTMKTIKMALGN